MLATQTMYAQIYIAPGGNDDSTGTIDYPYQTFEKAISVSEPGDTIYIRGGTYNLSATITISYARSGTADQLKTLMAYKDEIPVLDGSLLPSGKKGISLQSNYWHIKGLHITNALDNGMEIYFGSNNIVEQCQFYRNKDTGLQLSQGSANNQIINCDSYFNADPPDYGDADGFAPKLTVGSGNYFYGCRSWGNCDDGWDGYLRGADDISTTLENCWTWGNGYRENGTDPGSQANGNGFKMGGGDNSNSLELMHHMTLINCVAFDNKNKGFDQNNNEGSMTLLNCSGYNNITANFRIQRELKAGQVLTVKNSVSYDGLVQLGDFAVQETNSWLGQFQVNADDFISLDSDQASSARNADGSLPEIGFLHLAQGSDLIDAGTDLGYPFNGDAPDLGAFESDFTTAIEYLNDNILSHFQLRQNYPNPFNPATRIEFVIPYSDHVNVSVYDLSGHLVATLLDKWIEAGDHTLDFRARNLASAVYFYTIKTAGYTKTKKMLLVK